MAVARRPADRAQDRAGEGREARPLRQAARPEPRESALPKTAATRPPGPKRAAALERSVGRGTPHRHGHLGYRYAEAPVAPGPIPAVSGERAAAARALTADYLVTVSGPGDAMIGAANRFYATRIRFYGHPVTTAGLAAEKRSFVQRWPVRRYEPRAMSTACDAQTCTIRTLVDFRTANPERGAVSSGEAELILEVGFAGARPTLSVRPDGSCAAASKPAPWHPRPARRKRRPGRSRVPSGAEGYVPAVERSARRTRAGFVPRGVGPGSGV